MGRPLRIVLAEDEQDTREFLQELLRRLGHQVVAADNGRRLVELVRASEPDLVVTDIKMPDLDGIGAAKAIREFREVPVILITAHHEAELLERAAVDHVMAYLIKPVSQADVEAAVAVALARFGRHLQVRREVADLKQALEDRKVLERAKGAVMRRLRVEEADAYRRMRKLASDNNRKLAEVARAVLTAEEVFGQLAELGGAQQKPR
jgi:response regulator NasT